MTKLITLEELATKEKLLIVAHRGSTSSSPENTIPAFQEAILAGADMVEADVQFTRDQEIIIYHDRIASQFNQRIDMLDLNQVKSIDLYTSHNSTQFKIPTLDELLVLIRQKVYLLIELKKPNENIENLNKLIQLIRSENYLKYTLFASFHYENLKNLKEIEPTVHLAIIKRPGDKALPSQLARKFNARAYICSLDELNKEINNDARENDIFLGVYTVDTKSDLEKALEFNLKAIGTNFPAELRSWLYNNLK